MVLRTTKKFFVNLMQIDLVFSLTQRTLQLTDFLVKKKKSSHLMATL
jgi:hypothetical protein